MIRSPIFRLSVGIVSLTVCVVLLMDMFFGLVPKEDDHLRSARTQIAQIVVVQVLEKLNAQDVRGINSVLQAVRDRDPTVQAIGVTEQGGALVASSGPYPPRKADRIERVQVPIHSAQGVWGQADFVFPASAPVTLLDWLMQRRLLVAAGVMIVILGCVFLYLRRALSYLDPMAIVPDRVRGAFDALNEGVALLDRSGRVVLANRALRELAGTQEGRIHGRPLQEGAALKLPEGNAPPPWQTTMVTGQYVRDIRVHIGPHAERPGRLDCSPIFDQSGKVRGALVTVNDLTDIERSNDQLRQALAQLEHSQATVEAQNQELLRLAHNDGLTGLLNRRSFFESAESALSRCRRSVTPVAAVMLDVDHFKSFNDKYGHAVGDVVLQRVAKCLEESLRPSDLCGRYGGEEFCLLIDGLEADAAFEVADRMRRHLELTAGAGLHDGADLRVTASFGLYWSADGSQELADMLKQADAALYVAKRSGRNRVQRAEAVVQLAEEVAAA
jgi:diguanylate cyclase (GGDEF)-like protein/PAS domain S-box-containing protein